MIRQRVSLRTPSWGVVVRLLTVAFAIALIYGGVMLVLLAVKASPHTVEQISAYRSLYHDAAGLRPADFTTAVSLIAGFGGLLVFLIFAALALQALPRPYLTRSEFALPPEPRGATVVRPRAIERVAERAAEEGFDVLSAAGRLGEDELNLAVTLRDAEQPVHALAGARRRVGEQLRRHDLPQLPVHVTLTGFERYERTTRRDSA